MKQGTMRTIEVVIRPDGQSSVETKEFAGAECLEASRFLETALGSSCRYRRTSISIRRPPRLKLACRIVFRRKGEHVRAGMIRRGVPSGIRAAAPRGKNQIDADERPTLVLVEGIYDVEFLCRISTVLHRDDDSVTDLRVLENAGRLIFVPFGGGDPGFWATRFASLGLSEIHIFDRETAADSVLRFSAAAMVNRRANAQAFVTSKRSIESYLHPDAIEAAFRVRVACSADESIVDVIADALLNRTCPDLDRGQLSRRGRRRLKLQIKRKLNHDVVSNMTPALLDESDPRGEVRSWLDAIAEAVAYDSSR